MIGESLQAATKCGLWMHTNLQKGLKAFEEEEQTAVVLPRAIDYLCRKNKVMLNWKNVIDFAVNGNPTPDRRVEKTEAEWKAQLTPVQYRITRTKGTERPHSGALCSVYVSGQYTCVCCNTPLFDSTI